MTDIKKNKNDYAILEACRSGNYAEAIQIRRKFSHTSEDACVIYVKELCMNNGIDISSKEREFPHDAMNTIYGVLVIAVLVALFYFFSKPEIRVDSALFFCGADEIGYDLKLTNTGDLIKTVDYKIEIYNKNGSLIAQKENYYSGLENFVENSTKALIESVKYSDPENKDNFLKYDLSGCTYTFSVKAEGVAGVFFGYYTIKEGKIKTND